MTDTFRALCAELADELQGYKVANPMHCRALLDRARTALAEPESVRPDPPSYTEWDEEYLQADKWNRSAVEQQSMYEGFCQGWRTAP